MFPLINNCGLLRSELPITLFGPEVASCRKQFPVISIRLYTRNSFYLPETCEPCPIQNQPSFSFRYWLPILPACWLSASAWEQLNKTLKCLYMRLPGRPSSGTTNLPLDAVKFWLWQICGSLWEKQDRWNISEINIWFNIIDFTLSGNNCHGVHRVIVNIVQETIGLSFRTPLMVIMSQQSHENDHRNYRKEE